MSASAFLPDMAGHFGLDIAAGIVLETLQLLVSQPFLVRVLGKQPDLALFSALHGNLKWTLLALVGSWTLAAFGEEMVYRGYLMNRVAGLLRRTRSAWVISLLLVHVLDLRWPTSIKG